MVKQSGTAPSVVGPFAIGHTGREMDAMMRGGISILLAGVLLAGVFLYDRPSREQEDSTREHRLRPIAEFEPTQAMILSQYLFSETVKIEPLVTAILDAGSDLIILSADDMVGEDQNEWLAKQNWNPDQRQSISLINTSHESFWLRDFGPIPLRWTSSRNRDQLALASFIYREENSLDDTLPYQVGLHLNTTVLSLPLILDGGNFLTNGSLCLVTDNVTPRDKKAETGEDEVELAFSEIGCQQLMIIADAPHEHIDMWAKIVSPDTVLVNSLSPELIQQAEITLSDDVVKDVKIVAQQLEQAAATLAQRMKVVRIPMPLPYGGVFRTFANSVLINGVAILPKYEVNPRSGQPYIDQDMMAEMEAVAQTAYASFGYEVRWVNADELIINGGALHCVTAHLPRVGPSKKGANEWVRWPPGLFGPDEQKL